MLMKLATLLCLAVTTMGFVPATTRRKHEHGSFLSMALMTPPPPPPPAQHFVVMDTFAATTTIASPQSTPLTHGIDKFMMGSSSSSSSHLVALKERKIPTAEEIAAKKRNFNFWFWGGGFVAPFLATFYYFGLKFWEK
jgi:hypothetical protein